MEVREGTVAFQLDGEAAQTWYRVTGDLRPGDAAAPALLVVLHGGSGATHDYLLSLADLGESRAVIHYDQVGNGRSTHYPLSACSAPRPRLLHAMRNVAEVRSSASAQSAVRRKQ